jgi:TRAP-type mannitol/chloroaromatic compound transport system substrate-binding protein
VNRRKFVRGGAAAALGASAVGAPAIAQSAPDVKWRMTSSFSKSLDAIYGTAQTVCRYIAEATDNKFLIQPFAAGELAAGRQALDAVTSGSVECAHTPLYFYAGKYPTLGFGSGMPFGLNARHQQSWWQFGGGAEIVNAALKKFNAYGIPAGCTGAQMGAWFKKEINSLEDLKGLKFRVGALGGPILSRVGVVPHYLAYADVYAALESGAIDAAEFICPHDDEKLGFVKVAKYNYYPCWWESGGMMHMVVNLDAWNALPKAYQAILMRACDAANGWMLAKYDAINPPALKRLVAAGAILRPFPAPVMEACYKASNDYLAEVAAKDSHFKKALDSTNAFRKEQVPWWLIAEHAFDSFTVGARGRV